MKKSNIFAYTELRKLIDNLDQPGRTIKESIATQAAYFHILDPKYFSDALAPEWTEIREYLGYSSGQVQNGQIMLKNPMVESIQELTDNECHDILKRLKRVFESLRQEFGY